MDEETDPNAKPAGLTPAEVRVLGSLLEKERLVPDNYPMSLNALVNACNQTTARDPVMSLGDREVEECLDSLRRKKLATVVFGAGSRVQKYKHRLLDVYNLDERQVALLTTLLLRGPQTGGELRGRSERMAGFGLLAEVEETLDRLAEGDEPLVRLLAARPGQKERRFVQLLAGEPVIDDSAPVFEPPRASAAGPSRVDLLAAEVQGLRAELAAMREEFERFKKQFE